MNQAVPEPAARTCRAAVPPPVRKGAHALPGDLGRLVVLVSDPRQGDPTRAGITPGRFTASSTAGSGGPEGVATMMDVPGHGADAGQPRAAGGVGDGPCRSIPLPRASNPCDLAGFVVDGLTDPPIRPGQGAVVDTRDGLLDTTVDEIRRGAPDPQAMIRSARGGRRRSRTGSAPPGASRRSPAAPASARWSVRSAVEARRLRSHPSPPHEET